MPRMTEPTRIVVGGAAPYDVIIGRNLLGELTPTIGDRAQRVAIIHPGALRVSAEAIRADLADSYQTILLEIPEAEDAKNAAVAEFCWSALGQSGFTRTDAIVTLGGGATTDLGGFVAATWLPREPRRPQPRVPSGRPNPDRPSNSMQSRMEIIGHRRSHTQYAHTYSPSQTSLPASEPRSMPYTPTAGWR